MLYAFILKKKVQFSVPHNVKEIMIYTFFIILSGSVDFTFRYRQVNAESVYKLKYSLLFGGNLYFL
jgi:hypothetical protein